MRRAVLALALVALACGQDAPPSGPEVGGGCIAGLSRTSCTARGTALVCAVQADGTLAWSEAPCASCAVYGAVLSCSSDGGAGGG